MTNFSGLIAAAGKGVRAGLPYPKTLHLVEGEPILFRLFNLLSPYDLSPTLIVREESEDLFLSELKKAGRLGDVIPAIPESLGMGDSVSRFSESEKFDGSTDIILVWGDLPFLDPLTLKHVVDYHVKHKMHFTFPSAFVSEAYTIVERNSTGEVLGIQETRESGVKLRPGERDIGLFVFNKSVVFPVLEKMKTTYDPSSGRELSFLEVVKSLVQLGFKVEALPIAKPEELKSLNYLSDLN